MAQARICVVGSVNVDLTFRAARLPRLGETLAGSAFHFAFGGKGANQAVAAARLGARVSLVARVGDDGFGRESIQRLRVERLDTAHVSLMPERPTGSAAILVDDSAHNCIIVVPGANGALSPTDVRAAAPAIRGAQVLLAQLEAPLEATLEAFRLARAAGVRTILTPAPAAPLPDELLALTDLLAPNETELELLCRRPAGSVEDLQGSAEMLRNRGAAAVAVTLGERGALLVDASGATPIPPYRVNAVDPTGAGDAFSGSLAVFWAEGLTLLQAAGRASAVAALAVTRLGAQSAFPTREEFERFMAK